EADIVVGQADFTSASPNRGTAISASGLDTPIGLAFDAQNNLFVADFNNTRVLKFSGPVGPTAVASTVFGQASFTTRGVPPQATDSSLGGPTGVAMDSLGNLYVTVPLDNRIVVFSAASASGTASKDYIGQPNSTSTLANANAFPQASAATLSGPSDVKTTPDGTIYTADSGNNRVLAFPSARAKTASQVWGQPDFFSNGANQIKPGSINAPFRIAVDYSQEPFALYVSDTNNHRILAWKDASRFHTGDPADFVVGQPGFNTAFANVDTRGSASPSPTSLSSPRGIGLDGAGNLYVADGENNRVLRFPRPVDQTGRITPDLVIGQADFVSATSAAVNASTLRSPSGLAIGPEGNLFISDSGNNRVLEFPRDGRTAIRVYGQPGFTSGSAPSSVSAQTLTVPRGLYADGASTLYVADSGANRVLIFPNTGSAPSTGASASIVIGQNQFDQLTAGGGATRFNGPADVALDSSGNIYVSDNGNNRVLIFPSLLFLPLTGAAAAGVVGQRDLGGSAQNWNTQDGLATPEGLSLPFGLYVDRRDTLYVGDTGNNRVVQFLRPLTVANAAHLQASAPVAPGAIVSLFGSGLSDGEAKATETEWPAALAEREVVVNDEIRAAIASVSPVQFNLQVPSSSPLGLQRIAIRIPDTSELIAGGNLLVAAASPGFYSTTNDGRGQGVVLNQDGTANGPSNPAAKGSIIQLFGTGQGQVTPPVPDGTPAPADSPVNTVATPTADANTCISKQPAVCVAIGSTFGEIQFSGLAPGVIGVWQIKVKIPANALTGNAIPVRAVINATPSNLVNVAIR
ncbi:MAG: hypothetical protein ABIZ80_00980, partial [Bryobacteraceae bacterium]